MATTNPTLHQEGHIQVAGGQIWYGVVGELGVGKTPLMTIHGGPGMSHDYLLSLADLADERAVVFYDQLHAGRSDRTNDSENWVVVRFLDEIKSLRNALSLTRIAVFGNSWGGTLDAAYAATRPTGLERLVLSSPLIATKR